MKALIVLGIIVIVAVITNPKKNEHVDILKEKISQSAIHAAAKDMDSGNGFERAGAAIGVTLGLKFLDSIIESVVEVDNYLLFSLTKLSYDGNEKIIGIGAFGNVWLFGDLKDTLADLKK